MRKVLHQKGHSDDVVESAIRLLDVNNDGKIRYFLFIQLRLFGAQMHIEHINYYCLWAIGNYLPIELARPSRSNRQKKALHSCFFFFNSIVEWVQNYKEYHLLLNQNPTPLPLSPTPVLSLATPTPSNSTAVSTPSATIALDATPTHVIDATSTSAYN